ncbi:MAG: MerR family transcriptional regulator [Desulfosporosinus sp.]|nr:MerR family transcriptional regulator [Desulfosporosinus sp.]
MLYTVNEVANLTGVTVKALYHYHKINLLIPCQISEAGYRFYSLNELERLQQILFYRELDFSLNDIKKALEGEPSRQLGLANQYELLSARRQRLECLLKTLEESIILTKKGESMNSKAMFQGLNQAEWENALSAQNDYLKDKYDYDMLANKKIQVEDLNEKATESQHFLQSLSAALKSSWAVTDEKLHDLIEKHLEFLNSHGITIDAKSFVSQTRFFLEDDFHRNMLERQQPGLCYYLCIAAETYASSK